MANGGPAGVGVTVTSDAALQSSHAPSSGPARRPRGLVFLDLVEDIVRYRLLTVLITLILYVLLARAIFPAVLDAPRTLDTVKFTSSMPSTVSRAAQPLAAPVRQRGSHRHRRARRGTAGVSG